MCVPEDEDRAIEPGASTDLESLKAERIRVALEISYMKKKLEAIRAQKDAVLKISIPKKKKGEHKRPSKELSVYQVSVLCKVGTKRVWEWVSAKKLKDRHVVTVAEFLHSRSRVLDKHKEDYLAWAEKKRKWEEMSDKKGKNKTKKGVV